MQPLDKRLNLAVTPRLLTELRRVSDARETSVSEFVRQTLRRAVADEQTREQTKGAAQ
jgi:hypothetical protein